METLFWSVLAGLCLTLAIVTLILSGSVLRQLTTLKGSFMTERDPKNKKYYTLDSALHRAFKGIIIVDSVGFSLAAIAAVISALTP